MDIASTIGIGTSINRRLSLALEALTKADAESPTSEVLFAAGLIHEFGNSLSEARHFYSEAVSRSSEEAEIRLAIVLLKLGHPEQAAAIAGHVASRNPAAVTRSLTGILTSVHSVIGDCLRASGKSEAALLAYRTALAHAPEDRWARNCAARILIQSSKLEEARELDGSDLPRDIEAIFRLSQNDSKLLPQMAAMALNGALRYV